MVLIVDHHEHLREGRQNSIKPLASVEVFGGHYANEHRLNV